MSEDIFQVARRSSTLREVHVSSEIEIIAPVRRSSSCDTVLGELFTKLKQNEPNLIDISLSSRSLSLVDTQLLCEALSVNTFARSLDLSRCNLGENIKALTWIAKTLSQSCSLVNVDLSYNQISAINMCIFAKSLKQNINLRALRFCEEGK